jgi:hypothetical protein
MASVEEVLSVVEQSIGPPDRALPPPAQVPEHH